MQKITHNIDLKTIYDIHSIYQDNHICFFDIETTGLSRQKNIIYLIGAIYHEADSYKVIQWFNDDGRSEEMIIREFIDFMKNYQVLIHYNGTSFDIPFVSERAKRYGITFDTASFQSVDLYKITAKYKQFLSLSDMKQKSVELFLHIDRTDEYDGGTLIHIYYDYLRNRDTQSYELLLLHNYEDICGLVEVTDILSYVDMADGKYEITNIRTAEGTVMITCQLYHRLKSTFSVKGAYFYLRAEDNRLIFFIKAEHHILKFFYEDYKNYYYLPEEDMAIHKSVAQFVDKEHRIKATKENCYLKKEGMFIRQTSPIFEPAFKTAYTDKDSYALMSDAADSDKLKDYTISILKDICNQKKLHTS